jgi:hypothetical protein
MNVFKYSLVIALFTLRLNAQHDVIPVIDGFKLTTENDVFFPVNNGDANYTGQFRLDIFTKGILDKGWFPIRNFCDRENNIQSIFVNGQGYTPTRTSFDSINAVRTERPFASYICVGYQRTAWWNNPGTLRNWLVTNEITIGGIGNAAAGRVQNFLHDYVTINSKTVMGWKNQIGHPGRFAFSLRSYGLWAPNYLASEYLNLGLRYEITGGYFMNYGKLGVSLFNFDLRGLASNPDIPSVALAAIETRKADSTISLNDCGNRFSLRHLIPLFGYEIYPSVKYVTWNSMLSGHPIEGKSLPQSTYKIPSNEVNKIVPEVSIRIKLTWLNRTDERAFSLFYAVNWRGQEFSYGDNGHFWGTIGIQLLKL